MTPAEETHADDHNTHSMKKIDFDTECALQFIDIQPEETKDYYTQMRAIKNFLMNQHLVIDEQDIDVI